MNNQAQDDGKKILLEEWRKTIEIEENAAHKLIRKAPVSRNVSREFHDERSFGERIADRVAKFGGSWTFILIFAGILIFWVILNSVILASRNEQFDPYPYILLNLFLSMLAAIQAPIIMMSQNRQADRDRVDAAHDYEVNLKAEFEICGLHEKLDSLREKQLNEVLAMQQKQIELLQKLLAEKTKPSADI